MPLQRTLNGLDDLLQQYHQSNPERTLYVGIEWERSGIYRDSLKPVTFSAENGYQAVLRRLVDEVGWDIVSETDGIITKLRRGVTHVTIEGDGRLELSGSPQEDLHDLARELRIHANEVREMGNIFNIAWLPLGMQPLHGNDDIPLIPKKRYSIFIDLGERDLMETMAKRLNGLTVNFSYTDEVNAIRKAQVAFRILPIVGAMFASSPLDAEKPTGMLDTRRSVLQRHMPQRTGIPPTILHPDFSLREWLEYFARLPVVLLERNGGEERLSGDFSFLDWMEKGYEGIHPTFADFDRHVKTTWSDIRVRPSYLEYRVADSVPFKLAMSLPAFLKGLFFDSSAWEKIEEMTEGWTYDDILDADRRSWIDGLRTRIHGKPILTYAQQLLTFANEALCSFGRKDKAGHDETIYLAPLKERIFIRERNPAREVLALAKPGKGVDVRALLEWCEEN